MHTVVIQDEILEREPRVSESIYRAFKKSRDIGLERLEDPRTSGLVWASKYLEKELAFFEGSPWDYGLTDENLLALENYGNMLSIRR